MQKNDELKKTNDELANWVKDLEQNFTKVTIEKDMYKKEST